MRILRQAAKGLSKTIVAVLAAAAISAAPCTSQVLQIEGGEIADVAPDASGIRVFKGIPYAAPPVGDLRWKPPQPAQAWHGIRNATEWGPRCVQSNRLGDLDPLNKRMEEDCLYLNVWTPAKSPAESLPVMVWI